jgi:hypothetical protein
MLTRVCSKLASSQACNPKSLIPVTYHKENRRRSLIDQLNEDEHIQQGKNQLGQQINKMSRKAEQELRRFKRLPPKLRERVNKLAISDGNCLTRTEICQAADHMLIDEEKNVKRMLKEAFAKRFLKQKEKEEETASVVDLQKVLDN